MAIMKAKSSHHSPHHSLDKPDSFLRDGHNDNMASLSLIGKEDSGIYVFGTSLTDGSVYKASPETQQKIKSNNNNNTDEKESSVTNTYLQNLRRNSQEQSSLLSHSVVDREGRSSLEGSLYMDNYQRGKDDSKVSLSKIFDKDDSYIFGASVEGSRSFPSPRKIVQGTTVCIIGDYDDSDNSDNSESSLFNKSPYKNPISKSSAKKEISNNPTPNKTIRHLMPETEQLMIQKNKYQARQQLSDNLVGLHSLVEEQSRIDYDKKKIMNSKSLNERVSSHRSNNCSSSSDDHPVGNDTTQNPSRRKSNAANKKRDSHHDDISTGSSIRSENRKRLAAAKASSSRNKDADVGVSPSTHKKNTSISQSERRSTKNKNAVDSLPFSNLIITTSPNNKSINNNDRKSNNNNIADATLVCNDESSVSSLEDFTSRPRRSKPSSCKKKIPSSTTTTSKKKQPVKVKKEKVIIDIPLSISLKQTKQTDDASISSKTLPNIPKRSSSPLK